MKTFPPAWLARVAGALMRPGLDADEHATALDDLTVLADRVRERRGPVRAAAWMLGHAALHPLLHLWSQRPAPGGGGPRDRWGRDMRFALRRLRRNPVATAVVVLTLGIGVGAGTSVFAVLDVLVLRPLPFRDPDGLVRVRESMRVDGTSEPREVTVSARRYELLRDRADAFEDVAAARYRTFTLSGDGEAERIVGLWATWNTFPVLGVEPMLGRAYGPDEDAPGAAAPVVVISHSLWLRRFGEDPTAVGSELVINGRPHTVLGVMPPGFRYPYAGEVWLPMGIDPAGDDYEDRGLNVSARLAAGMTLDALPSELDRLSQALAAERPELDEHTRFTFRTLEAEILEGVPEKVVALLWAAVFVLLIGAANIASMVLARLHAERSELDVQVVLGASRADLVRRFASESVILALLGSALGVAVSGRTVGLLTALSPVSDLGPYFQNVAVGLRGALFGSALAFAAMAVAATPTLSRLRGDSFGASMRSRVVGSRRGRLGVSFLDTLVSAEVALAVVLLAGAGLTVQTLRAQWSESLGIRAEDLHTFGVSPAPSGYRDDASRVAYVEAVLERVRALPGVEAAGLTNLNPMRSHGWGAAVWPEGRDVSGSVDYFAVNHRAVTPGYLAAAGTGLVEGRDFGPGDGPDDRPVAIVSRRTASLFWPGESPVGKALRVGSASGGGELVTVVGVTEDVREFDFLDDTWYRPLAQDPRDYNTEVLEIFVRSRMDASLLVPEVRRAIREVDPTVPIFSVEAMEDLLRFERRIESFAVLLLLLFAGVGIGLSAVGVYGVLTYATGRRLAELGLRRALGAGRSDVVVSVTWRALRSCVVGLAAGLVGALALARFLEAVVPGVPPFRFDVYLVAAAATLLAAALAALGPARKALRVEPRTALSGP